MPVCGADTLVRQKRPTLPHTFACTTIGPAGLNLRRCGRERSESPRPKSRAPCARDPFPKEHRNESRTCADCRRIAEPTRARSGSRTLSQVCTHAFLSSTGSPGSCYGKSNRCALLSTNRAKRPILKHPPDLSYCKMRQSKTSTTGSFGRPVALVVGRQKQFLSIVCLPS